MDNRSDDTIIFDDHGVCNYCTYALSRKDSTYFPNEIGYHKLTRLVERIKLKNRNKSHDCIMGISGGLDSSYLAYLGSKFGLRILAVHVDDSFNTTIAERNIKNLCNACNIDLIIEKPDRKQFNDVTRSFFLAGLPGICNAQDNVIMAYLYKYSVKNNIRDFLSGGNFSLESILQRGHGLNFADGYHIEAVHKIFGSVAIDSLPLISLYDRYIKFKYFYQINSHRPLDYIDYRVDKALTEMKNECGFSYYGGKHYESILTKFAQTYYLPQKFNLDKRKSHYSSLIISGQMTREQALQKLNDPLYESETQLRDDLKLILDAIDLSAVDFEKLMHSPPNRHTDYPHSRLISFADTARKFRKYLEN